MKFIIKHEIKGRIRISLARKFHTVREADVLEQYLLGLDGVTAAKVYERTADAVIYYKEDREAVLVQVAAFDGQITEKQEMAVKSSGRALNQEYKEKLIQKVLTRFATKTFLPAPVRAVYTSVQAIRYIVKGIHCLVFKRKRMWRCWMRRRSVFPFCAAISIRLAPLCSCSASVSFWRSGHIRNPLVIWRGACP